MPEPRALVADDIPERSGTGYPEPFRAAVAGRTWRALGDAFGLADFGVNLCAVPPGAANERWNFSPFPGMNAEPCEMFYGRSWRRTSR